MFIFHHHVGKTGWARGFALNEATRRFLREIRNDNRSGASEITERAAECLIAFLDNFEGRTHQDFVKELQGVGLEITRAQPAMAPLFNLVNSVLLTAEETRDLKACRVAVKEKARDFMRTLEKGWKAMADFAVDLVRESSTILVHSYSATLYRILLALQDQRRGFSVICTESRPLLEGVTLARRLAEKDIPVRLVVDAAAFQLLQQVDLVFVGADTISPAGVINKIGTRGLAMAAQCQDVPFYVLAGTEKCLPMDDHVKLEREMRPRDEILEGDEPIKVLNFYFDRTPLDLVSGVVTERGVVEARGLQEYFGNLKIHRVLTDRQGKRR